MKPQFQQAYNALRTLGVPVFEREDRPERFFISAEHAESGEWVDYYSGYRDWSFGVHPAVDATLQQFGLFAEWENPGCLMVCEG